MGPENELYGGTVAAASCSLPDFLVMIAAYNNFVVTSFGSAVLTDDMF